MSRNNIPKQLLSMIVIRDRNPLTTRAATAIVTVSGACGEARSLDTCFVPTKRRGMRFRDPAT